MPSRVEALAASVAAGLPAPPPPALDPLLDAAARCFARHGIARTAVPDIAREARVSRATVYRQVGGVDDAVRLLLARELHRLLVAVPLRPGAVGPREVVAAVATSVQFARAHPVMGKVLRDEPELLGPLLAVELPAVVGRVTAVLAPVLAAGIAGGTLARRDPVVLAEWLVRLGLTLVLVPPPGEVAAFLAEVLVPALTPPAPDRRSR